MNRIIKIIPIIIFSTLLCFLSYKLCYFLAENYFFDKFFYQKSASHGYWLKNKSFSDYSDRAGDIITWESHTNDSQEVLGINDNSKTYKIAIIGDSYTWGEGLKNNQRFVKLLSDKLNKTKPTEIISLAKPGWNNLDYLNAYLQMKKYYSPNLIIFVLVTNDILINTADILNPIVENCYQKNQNSTVIYDTDINNISLKNQDDGKNGIMSLFLDQVWENSVNECIIDNSLNNLPTNNSLYFLTEDYIKNDWNQVIFYKEHLLKHNKYILSSGLGKNIPKYTKYWNDDLWKNFIISSIEGHPNALANQMYADILYQEITTNPKWNF